MLIPDTHTHTYNQPTVVNVFGGDMLIPSSLNSLVIIFDNINVFRNSNPLLVFVVSGHKARTYLLLLTRLKQLLVETIDGRISYRVL